MLFTSSDDEVPIIIQQPKESQQNRGNARRRIRRGRDKAASVDISPKKENTDDKQDSIVAVTKTKRRRRIEKPKSDNEFSEDSQDDLIIVRDQIQFTPPITEQETPEIVDPPKPIPIYHQTKEIDTSIPNYSNQEIYGTYFIERTKRMHVRSYRYYKFKTETKTYITAKEHGLIHPEIYMNEGENVHIKSLEYTHKVEMNMGRSSFSLFNIDNTDGIPLATIDYDSDYGESIGPRKIKLAYKDEFIYRSKIPKRAANGFWKLSFGGHFTISSCRNSILLDKDLQEAIVIRKVGSNVLEITVKIPTPLIAVALVAITSYIYKE